MFKQASLCILSALDYANYLPKWPVILGLVTGIVFVSGDRLLY